MSVSVIRAATVLTIPKCSVSATTTNMMPARAIWRSATVTAAVFSGEGSNISIELGTDADVTNLERLWDSLVNKYPDVLGVYQPFFSVDTPADGQGKELFHLRVGPVKSLDAGDSACSRLGRNGVFCSVVRTQ